ncbi:MAG TPA: WD40 repeat domain-containing protein [Planctomycetota bacterium]
MQKPPLVLEAHAKHAQAVHFTRDGKHLVTCGQDAAVRVWSVPGFRAERELLGHTKSVNALAFTADESRLLTSSSDPAVKLWSFRDGKCLHTFEDQVHGAIGPDGAHVVTISRSGELTLWDGDTGAKRRALPALDKRHLALAFSQNGLFLFVGGTGPIHRLSLPDGEVDGVHRGHQIAVACLRASPNPAILASSGMDGTLRFWTVIGGDEVNQVALGATGALQLAFAPDGRSIAVSVDHAVLLLSAPDGVLRERFDLPVKGVYGVAIAPDGRTLANAAADGRVRLFEL